MEASEIIGKNDKAFFIYASFIIGKNFVSRKDHTAILGSINFPLIFIQVIFLQRVLIYNINCRRNKINLQKRILNMVDKKVKHV